MIFLVFFLVIFFVLLFFVSIRTTVDTVISQNTLRTVVGISSILSFDRYVVFPWVCMVNHHFISSIHIDMAISTRKRSSSYPSVTLIIGISTMRYVIIRIDFGDRKSTRLNSSHVK